VDYEETKGELEFSNEQTRWGLLYANPKVGGRYPARKTVWNGVITTKLQPVGCIPVVMI
jgi:hypothetical protein